MEVNKSLAWTFVEEIAIPSDIISLLLPEERAIGAYKTFRDVAVFTTKRLIVSDAQGITGKKKEMYSLPYSSINMWSSENASGLDFNSEIELWTKAGNIKIKLNKNIDIRKIDYLIAQEVLKNHN